MYTDAARVPERYEDKLYARRSSIPRRELRRRARARFINTSIYLDVNLRASANTFSTSHRENRTDETFSFRSVRGELRVHGIHMYYMWNLKSVIRESSELE